MKLSELRYRNEPLPRGLPVYLDKYAEKGTAYVLNDAVIVQSLGDDIERFWRWESSLKKAMEANGVTYEAVATT